jgi:hypothetical protein
MAMPMKVAPRGLPMLRSWVSLLLAEKRKRSRRFDEACSETGTEGGRMEGSEDAAVAVLEMELFRRKSWVTAMPMEAKARDVRSQARNVRSFFIYE